MLSLRLKLLKNQSRISFLVELGMYNGLTSDMNEEAV